MQKSTAIMRTIFVVLHAQVMLVRVRVRVRVRVKARVKVRIKG